MATDVTEDDLNGDFYVGTLEGENYVRNTDTAVLIPDDVKMPENPDYKQFPKIIMIKKDLDSVLNANLNWLVDCGIDKDVATKISYIRLVAVKHGLMTYKFLPAAHNVDYNDALSADVTKIANLKSNLVGKVGDPFKAIVKASFTDWVCMLAYVFRVRGHHWTAEYDKLYNRVWNHCQPEFKDPTIEWKFLMIHALHGIMPDVLENFWTHCVNNGLCNGALIKRYNSAPAGAAAPMIIYSGLKDILLLAPGLRRTLPKEIKYIEEVHDKLLVHRYNGSVNARYYGAQRMIFDEKEVGAIAAAIVSALTVLVADSELLKSPSLNRVARLAPLTGAILGRAIKGVADQDNLVRALASDDLS